MPKQNSLVRQRKRWQYRRGVVAPLVALCLIAMLGIVALVIDAGLMEDRKRHLQGAADAAALAAATDIFTNWYQGTPAAMGKDPQGTAKASAVGIAKRCGYTDDGGVTTTVTVNIANAKVGHVNPSYPTTDGIAFPDGYAEVIITYKEPARFITIFGMSQNTVSARALARGRYVGTGDGVILLDPHASGALTVKGSGNSGGITVNNGDITIDSDSQTAGVTSGSHAIVTSQNGFYTRGNVSGNFLGGPIVPGSPPLPDPLRALPAPTAAALNLPTQTYPSGSDYTMSPGVYTGGFQPSGNVTLKPGIYIINGDIKMAGQGNSVTGVGVMIYFTGGFSTTGSWNNAGWNITAPPRALMPALPCFSRALRREGSTSQATARSP
jgi:Putative Flp pilus-assembly TadE/G-like